MSAATLKIADRPLGDSASPYLIAEVGLAHEGSLGVAHAFIDAIAETGCEAVKFQTHIASEESTAKETFRVKVFPQDETRYDYWHRTSFELAQWQELAEHAREKGLHFLSSPFSELAVDWLMECRVPAWKVASGELTNHSMLEKMISTGLPLLVSSGMSSWEELDQTVGLLEAKQAAYAIFQCTTSYPCPPDTWGLNLIPELQQRYRCPIGLSDHSGSPTAQHRRGHLRCEATRIHVTFHRSQFGPDVPASLTFEEVEGLVRDIKNLHTAIQHPVDKNDAADQLRPLHDMFTKSVVAKRPLDSGHQLTTDDFAFKKPGVGWPANDAGQLIGRVLRSSVEADHFFAETDFE